MNQTAPRKTALVYWKELVTGLEYAIVMYIDSIPEFRARNLKSEPVMLGMIEH